MGRKSRQHLMRGYARSDAAEVLPGKTQEPPKYRLDCGHPRIAVTEAEGSRGTAWCYTCKQQQPLTDLREAPNDRP